MINATTTIVVIGSTGKAGMPVQTGSGRNAPTAPSDVRDIALTTRWPSKRVSLVTSQQQPYGL